MNEIPEARRADVRKGGVLRTVALLLCPGWDLVSDRFQAVELLRGAGVPDSAYDVQDANPALPEIDAESMPRLLRRDGRWSVGATERGRFSGRAYETEAEAARAFIQTVIALEAVSMGGVGVGGKKIEPHIRPRYQEAARRALAEASALLSGAS
ncbi:hypothetical protein [Thermomonospora amylolytica]|uniref:hypothetical protein n=1 Tax=Thermomonospora amylolytica TaxID=1411117 RepID=UPI000E6BCE4B|nr:hypothetical protein [Thermomonospora amylolytica]